jgi:hypothetical protein
VEALFAERIVDESDDLKERALRRKALRIADDLLALSSARAAEDRAASQAARERRDALRGAAAKLRRERRALAPTLDRALEPARRLLSADLRPLAEVAEGREATDPALRAYVEERFVARLSDALAAEIARAAQVTDPPKAAVRAVRAVLMGAAAAHAQAMEFVDRPIERVVEAAVEAFAMALLSEASAPPAGAPWAALEHRAQAVSEALRAAKG